MAELPELQISTLVSVTSDKVEKYSKNAHLYVHNQPVGIKMLKDLKSEAPLDEIYDIILFRL